jgi:HlyD family secretion protein
MSRGWKAGIGFIVVVAALGGWGYVRAQKKKAAGTEVRIEKVGRRDLVAAVTASGKIQPETKVDISADITGRILQLGVKEGDVVTKGQFLVQIDPAQYEAAVAQAEGLVASNEATLLQVKATRDQAERALTRAKELAKRGADLIAPEQVEQAQTSYDVATANYNAGKAQLDQARASLQQARDNLRKTRLVSPISGRVTRLPVEVGEVAVPSTFSKENGLLMTIADLSVILAKVQVDETDIVRLSKGDSVQVAIDAFPDTTFLGHVTKISHSATLQAAASTQGNNSSDRAVDFDVEITLANPPKDIRPDLSCTARVVTATRSHALSIPIIALTVRDNQPVPSEAKPADDQPQPTRRDTVKFAKKETEGVFVVRDGVASFRPVKVGVAGDEYFEVLDGLREGEEIVAGTYQAIRDLKDGARVHAAPPPGRGAPTKEAKAS